jgi:hypothetical protein
VRERKRERERERERVRSLIEKENKGRKIERKKCIKDKDKIER